MGKNKRIAYGYLFNYFGGERREGKIVSGAGINLNIRAYKDGKEILFEEDDECRTGECYLSDVFDIRFDREKQFVIEKSPAMDVLFRITFGWDRIEASVKDYNLDVIVGLTGDEMKGLPEEFQNMPISEPVIVTEKEFREFLASHVDDFDITDNKHAQVPSVEFYDVPEETKD